jgi:hypothetical protein
LPAKVWVTFPRSVEEAIQVLWAVVRVFRLTQAQAKVQTLELTMAWTARAAAAETAVPTFVPIWEGEAGGAGPWWIDQQRRTYVHDLLAFAGRASSPSHRRILAADVEEAPSEEQPGGNLLRMARQGAERRQADPAPSGPYLRRNRRLANGRNAAVAADHGRIRQRWKPAHLARDAWATLAELPGLIRPVQDDESTKAPIRRPGRINARITPARESRSPVARGALAHAQGCSEYRSGASPSGLAHSSVLARTYCGRRLAIVGLLRHRAGYGFSRAVTS